MPRFKFGCRPIRSTRGTGGNGGGGQGVRLEIHHNCPQVIRQLRHIRRELGDPRDALREMGRDAVSHTLMAFRRSTDPWGHRWLPLRPATIRRRRGRSSRPLLDTGRLRSSFGYHVSGRRLVIGSDVKYAALHQFGGGGSAITDAIRRRGRVPARPMLPIRGGQVALPRGWRDMICEHLDRQLSRAVRGR